MAAPTNYAEAEVFDQADDHGPIQAAHHRIRANSTVMQFKKLLGQLLLNQSHLDLAQV